MLDLDTYRDTTLFFREFDGVGEDVTKHRS